MSADTVLAGPFDVPSRPAPSGPPPFAVEERIKGVNGHRRRGGEKSGDHLGGYVTIGRDAGEIAAYAE
ncbi:hypothetical protein [Kitasatospora cathayae]|uniref:Uncharacterized protein n=1 Tax=Kitasatospora cathayae TaxID=3004092 RepID=A0ABY7Q0B1_9ACTN|nr:hypothetical protein [Kitasatospora sp. HUAS 3-15]WBP86131.1 hypothetical protein O1G21_09950 [Kitasatospora sp. HUAS 3-15]